MSDELILLREFFRCWEYLHSLRTDGLALPAPVLRQRMQLAAQSLVDAADAVNAFHGQAEPESAKIARELKGLELNG